MGGVQGNFMTDLGLSALISDGMIIQRSAAFPIWSKEKISVTFIGKKYESQNVDCKWLITLDPVQAGGPFTMDIACADSSFTVADIYSGDVWMCAGQSNMEMMMDRLRDDFAGEWESEEFPFIRTFKVPQEWDFSSPREELTGGSWISPSKETLREFSGTGWFFAKELYKKYRIPIGLVITAWGGTPIESWMSEDALKDFPEKIAEGRQYADGSKRAQITKETADAITKWEICLKNEDRGLSEKWKNPQTDISGWDSITLPCDFSAVGLNKFCGVIWLAKDFYAGAEFASEKARVWLGTITDADTVYMNGVEIGNTAYRYPPRKYTCEGLIKQGKNRIVIRVICNDGDGGITHDKPFRIFIDNGTIELAGTWKYKTGTDAPVRPTEFFFQRHPVGNYNAMIAPVLKYPLKGVIWYQGESNDSSPRDYARLFRLMIQDWRKKSSNKELTFLFVQLPIWKAPSDNSEDSSWALIRSAQADALSLPATGMAAALELGEWNDLHPVNKKDVGIRLFLAAEKVLFNIENSSPGPTFQRIEKRQEKLYLYFDNCADGLKTVPEGEKPYVSVIDEEKQNRRTAEICGKNVICIDVSSLNKPKKILYAWADNPRDRQLFNSEGLPMLPFRIEVKESDDV
ncbi:MAG: sialate O-acetylesterase [Treponema sp.]|jgi:sialate O-acetylesterase|nr:sialate O-acetylesterase [Treponema sp.]